MTFIYFQPQTHYRRGDRVLTRVLDKVCLWECVTEYTSGARLEAYVYSTNRKKVYYWKQLCCEPYDSQELIHVYYGKCAENIPRSAPSTYTYPEFTEDTYENNIFL